MDLANLHRVSASEAARLIRQGAVSSRELVEACLARVREIDAEVRAWAFLDPEYAVAQARAADDFRASGQSIGPLHGVPVGIEDVIDTGDMPTENGSPLHAGRAPSRDATAVAMLRAAGAVIMGKTATAELAAGGPGKSRNPHNPAHAPGGSSGGSAAAVAAGMAPAALGTQTGGSVIGSASFCGVFGFKPTHGLVPRHGVLAVSRTLDHVGVFARTVDDVALVSGSLVGYDERDPDTRPRAAIPFVDVALEEPPLPPMFALVKTPYWARADGDTTAAFGELVEHLGDRVEEVELPLSAAGAWGWHQTIMDAEMAANFEREWERGRDRLSARLRERIERGRQVSALDYQRAIAGSRSAYASFCELFEQRYDAILTPAALGTAPAGLESAGAPVFCALWTLLGMPSLGVPLMQGAGGLPLGVQLVGARHGDARLLRTARWLLQRLAGDGGREGAGGTGAGGTS